MKAWLLTASALAALASGGPAAAQFRNAADAIGYRQAALTVLGHHFGAIAAMVNGKTPYDAQALQADAEVVAMLAKLPWAGFVPGTDKGDTDARPEIWANPAPFRADAQALQVAAAKLAAAARGGDREAVRSAFGVASQACKSCHDDFRKRR